MHGPRAAYWKVLFSFLCGLAACSGDGETTTGTGGAGGTGGAPECVAPEDCVPTVPDCQTLKGCIDGACVFNNEPEGKPTSTQALDDCQRVVCDGQGSTKTELDPTDMPTDDSPCTEYSCNGTMLMKTVLPAVPCYSGPDGTQDVGICKGGMMACNDLGLPEGACEGEVLPSPQMCGPQDTDCDGQPGDPCP